MEKQRTLTKKYWHVRLIILMVGFAAGYYFLHQSPAPKTFVQKESLLKNLDPVVLEQQDRVPSQKNNSVAKSVEPVEVAPVDPVAAKIALARAHMKPRKVAQSLDHVQMNLKPNQGYLSSNWQLWSGVKAKLKMNTSQDDQVLYTAGNMSFVATGDQDYVWKRFDEEEKSVVYDPETRRVGYVTGQLKVTGVSENDLHAQRAEVPFTVVMSFPDINVFFVNCDGLNLSVERCFAELKKLNLKVEIEVVHQHYEKK